MRLQKPRFPAAQAAMIFPVSLLSKREQGQIFSPVEILLACFIAGLVCPSNNTCHDQAAN